LSSNQLKLAEMINIYVILQPNSLLCDVKERKIA
jgi:hypothetical protein